MYLYGSWHREYISSPIVSSPVLKLALDNESVQAGSKVETPGHGRL